MIKAIRHGLVACVLLVACTLVRAQPDTANAIRPDERIETTYVLHYAPAPAAAVEEVAAQLLHTQFASLRPSLLGDSHNATVRLMLLDMEANGIKPPGAESEALYRYGVAQKQLDALQISKLAVVLAFSYDGRAAVPALEQATAFTRELARRTDALIWDAETRELFAPDAWAERRMAASDTELPEVRKHIAIRAYQVDGERIRAITSGMRKFGLPDVVVNDAPWWLTQEIGTTMRLLAQALVEGPAPALGMFDLDVTTIRQQRIRKHIEASLDRYPTASVAFLALRAATPLAGDPDNRLIEITFDRYPGRNTSERYARFTSEFFGPSERASRAEPQGDWLVASKR
ncbi:MAG: hypothetical protein ABW034_23495 [Steroidobacteraceae bacterium]